MKEMDLLTDLFRAYYDARRHKRNSAAQLRFEMDLEENLLQLYHEIAEGSYKPCPSHCFIVYKPVKREIFAAQFRDRVVHHLLYNYIAPALEQTFIDDSYSCRKGKGTSAGVNRLAHHIRSCSQNYTRMAYVMKLDIQGFFMSIDRMLLFNKMTAMIEPHFADNHLPGRTKRIDADKETVLFLLREICLNNPVVNCIRISRNSEWEGLPQSKSLFHSPVGVGLPIGNLTSQLFSNIYLNAFDHYVKRILGVKHYGRYVDDFYLVDNDKEKLIEWKKCIKNYLKENLGLVMHPDKIYLQDVCKGVSFLGVMIKPHRLYVGRRTKINFMEYIHHAVGCLNELSDGSDKKMECIQASVNSYLGYMKRYKTFKMRRIALLNSGLLNACQTDISTCRDKYFICPSPLLMNKIKVV